MGSSYHQFCPVAKAMELLDERWTLLIVREMLAGSSRFNELRPIVEGIGAWGVRWIGDIGDQDLDPKLLMWDMHRNVDHSAIPDGRSVVAFNFSDVAPTVRSWWLVLTAQEVDVCDADPGFPVEIGRAHV